MDVKLIVVGGKNAGRVVPVTGGKFLIGRAEDCHLRPNSDAVSRHHCAITLQAGRVTIADLGSRNGTLVNGQRIKGEEELKSGDHLRVGPLEFQVAIEVTLGGQKRPKVHSVEEAAARTVETAAAKPPGAELDVSSWVTDTVDGTTDTKSMTASRTAAGVANTPPPADKTPSPEGEQGEKETKEEKKQKKPQPASPSAIHGLKKPKAADSQSAAAETLRAFFNRK